MPRVVALYRYPVKEFTPEQCEAVNVLDEGRIVGDRVLGVRFADAGVMDDAWSKKHQFVALMNTPGIARLQLRFDHQKLRLCISLEGEVLANEALDEKGRIKIAAAIENYVLKLDEDPLSSRPDRLHGKNKAGWGARFVSVRLISTLSCRRADASPRKRILTPANGICRFLKC